jgi:hypothetical protein
MQEEIQKYTQKKGKPVPLNVIEANQGRTVTPALFLNLATKQWSVAIPREGYPRNRGYGWGSELVWMLWKMTTI